MSLPASPRGGDSRPPVPQAGGLPASYTPQVARYASGPWLDEQVVTPSTVKWMNARTYVVRDRSSKQEYRALRVCDDAGHTLGYWAVELMPAALDLGREFAADREDAIDAHEAQRRQDARDARARRYTKGRPHA